MKKIILYVHQSADLYGSDRVLLGLVTMLDREKFFPIVLLPVDGPLVNELVAASVECHVVPIACLSRATLSAGGISSLFIDLIKSIFAINRILKSRCVNIVHSNTLAVLSGAIWAFCYRVPHVWHVHEIILRPKFVRKIYASLMNWFADCVICISNATKDNLLQDLPALAGRIVVIWNGLAWDTKKDTDAILQKRNELGIEEDEVLIAMVGRINRWKGQILLVKAAELLWRQGIRQVRFLIVGSAPHGQQHYLHTLQEVIRESPAKQCIRIQQFTQNISLIWDSCDIAVIPSIEPEPFGMVALEAMAASKPVIAANHGGLAEIVVQKKTGLLVPPSDENALAEAIKQLVTDEDFRHELGKAGLRRYRSKFTLNRQVKDLSIVYEQFGL